MSFLTNSGFYFFLLQLLLNYIVFGVIVSGFIYRLLKSNSNINTGITLVSGIGLAPYFTSLLLYYLLVVIPKQNSLFYFSIIVITYTTLAFILKKEIIELINIVANWSKAFAKKHKRITTISIIFFTAVFLAWSYYINRKTISEHDTLEYAVQGKIFYKEKVISYSSHRYDETSCFYYVGLHGFSFPLLATWERFQDDITKVNKDLFFRSINGIYGILILLTLFLIGYNYKGSTFGFVVAVAVMFTYGFFETILKYHLDNFRIFFLNISILAMYNLINKYTNKTLIWFSIFLGAQANTHSLGALLAITQLAIIFLFIDGKLIEKIKRSTAIFILFIITGFVHYLIDIFYGTGWIFQDLKFY